MFLPAWALLCLVFGGLNAEVIDEEPLEDPAHREIRLAYQNPDLLEGDMILPPGAKNGIPEERFRWPGYPGSGVIPFYIDPSVANIRQLIYKAMQHYHQHTCIRFVERTNQKDYVHIYKGNGCFSMVGRRGTGAQELSLGNRCEYFGLIVHELGHAVGFFHEQNRSDRDDYLHIYMQNVLPNQRHNFQKLYPNENILYTQFDYKSIMCYGNYAFSGNGKMTMQSKNNHPLVEPWLKDYGMTQSDIMRVRTMYRCR